MAMRSAMRSALRNPWQRRLWRQQHGHGEYRALPGASAVSGDVTAHATRELARDCESETRAVGDALPAAAIVEVEQFLCRLLCEAAPLVANLEAPPALAGCRGKPDATAAILVSVVQQVFDDHPQTIAIRQHMHGIDRPGFDFAADSRAFAMCQQVGDELGGVDGLRSFTRITRHGALIGENGLGQMFQSITFDLAQFEELGTLRFRNAADGQALEQAFHAGHGSLELVA